MEDSRREAWDRSDRPPSYPAQREVPPGDPHRSGAPDEPGQPQPRCAILAGRWVDAAARWRHGSGGDIGVSEAAIRAVASVAGRGDRRHIQRRVSKVSLFVAFCRLSCEVIKDPADALARIRGGKWLGSF